MGKRFAVASAFLAALAFSAACGVHQTVEPGLAGPSELSTSFVMTAIPDSISQDGASQSSVTVWVRDANAKPIQGLAIRLDMAVDGTTQDYGTLSARTVVTGSDGKAFAIYTAPPAPPPSVGGSGTRVQIVVRPIGSNAQISSPPAGPAGILQTVDIRLIPPGVIQGPAGSPTAAFTMSPTPVVVDIPVTFDASTSQVGTGATSITSYAWTFGDGSSGTGRSVAHTFSAAATFNVTLTVTNDRGLSASSTVPVTVGAGAAGGGPGGSTTPTAAFTYSPQSPGVNATVFFNASTSSPGTGHTISSYAWTFGDGTSGSGVSPTHAYGAAGSYGVQLTVTDETGQTATSAPTAVSVGSNSLDPTAGFTFSPTAPSRNETVVFDASSSTTAQGQTITDVAWNFGDSTGVVHCPADGPAFCSGTNSRITPHRFLSAGSFVVNLVVTDSAGRTGSKNTTIVITSGDPVVKIDVSPGSPFAATPVNFDSSGTTYFGSAGPQTISWLFPGGVPNSSALGNQNVVYNFPGTYTVRLTITDTLGRTGTITKDVTVQSANPTANLVITNTAGTSITADGSGSTALGGTTIATYTFIWGDGTPNTTGAAASVPHTYAAPGSYTVRLTVTDSLGRTGTTTALATIP
jgi:PKD repeat protein